MIRRSRRASDIRIDPNSVVSTDNETLWGARSRFSHVPWQATANEIRDGVHHEPSLHLRDIGHLWWTLNAIAAAGGSATIPAGPGRMPPHWPDYDRVAIDGIKYREDSLSHLAKLGYLAIERGADTLTISYGPVTVKLADSFRETVGRKAD